MSQFPNQPQSNQPMYPPQHQPQHSGMPPGTPQRTNGPAIASLVLGILGCVPLITSILAVIFGIIGIRKTRDPRYSGKGLAIAGLVLGLIGLLLWGSMGGGLYTIYVVSRPVSNVAHQFTKDIAAGNITAAQAQCESSITSEELDAIGNQFKQWGAFTDLTILSREANSTGGQTTWDLEGFANFNSGMKEAKFKLRKQSDGSYKITSAAFDRMVKS